MNLQNLFDGFIIGFMASVPLGPIGVLCIQRTLSKGKLSGFISGLGAASSDVIYAIIALTSLSYVITIIEQQFLLLKIFGVVLLLFLGLKIFYTNPAKTLRKQNKKSNSYLQDFMSTFFLTITNPFYIFLFIGLFASLGAVAPQTGIFNQLILIAGVFAGASFWWFILTSIVNLFRAKINLRRLWWINKIAGGLIVLLVLIAFIYWVVKEYLLT